MPKGAARTPFAMRANMGKPQRIILAIYCLSLAYCLVWIPWSVTSSDRYGTNCQRLGYGWVWAGPQYPDESAVIGWPRYPQKTAGTASVSDIQEFTSHSEWDGASSYARPDLPLVFFRLIALSLIFVAASVLASFRPKSATLN